MSKGMSKERILSKNGGSHMIYANERKLCLSGWLFQNGRLVKKGSAGVCGAPFLVLQYLLDFLIVHEEGIAVLHDTHHGLASV